MINEIIIACISGLCVALPSIYSTKLMNDKTNAILHYRIEELSKKVEKHNSVVERMALAENQIHMQNNQLEELRQEVREMERGV